MDSKIKYDSSMFICFCEVAKPSESNPNGWVIQRFPEKVDDDEEEMLKSVPKFAYPCEINNEHVQHFSFVMKSGAKWMFGFCRHNPKSSTALVFLSYLPWDELFTRLLNEAAEIIRSQEANDLFEFLALIQGSELPPPGSQYTIQLKTGGMYKCTPPCPNSLPSIPENKILMEYINAVNPNGMLVIFASILSERRIVFKSRRLNRLSSCVRAANTLIYPMCWQHIFIPIIPRQLTDVLAAPMPYLVGVPTSTWEHVKRSTRTEDLGDIVILDCDTSAVETPHQDVESMPDEIVKFLKNQLKSGAPMWGDTFAKTFLKALVPMIGGYRDALKFQPGQKITFSFEAFIESRPKDMQPFLRKLWELQIFQQFLDERLEMLNAGLGFSDTFDVEAYNYLSKTSTSSSNDQYKEWISNMRKQGTAFFKTVKNKANPAVKSAVKSVKERGKDVKSAYRGIKTRMRHHGESRVESGSTFHTFHRDRPLTVGPPVTAATTFKKQRVTSSVMNSRSNEYVPLGSPTEGTMSPPEEDLAPTPPPRLEMDLLGDLQEVINQKCSLLDTSPPVDRTLKPTRSLSGSPRDRLNPAFHLPLTKPTLSLPLSSSPKAFSSPTNPFAFALPPMSPFIPDPFGFHSEVATVPKLPTHALINFDPLCPYGTALSQPLSNQYDGSRDLIRLDSELESASRNFTPDSDDSAKGSTAGGLSRDCSDDSIKFKTGLTNPLYPFYTLPTNETKDKAVSPSQSFPPNSSFVHTNLNVRNTNLSKQDIELLQEYGMDFKMANPAGTLASTPNSNFHYESLFEETLDSNSKRTTKSSWATFD